MNQPIVHLGPDCVYIQWAERGEVTALHRDGSVTYQFRSPVHSDVCQPMRTSHLDSVESNNKSFHRGYDIGHAEGYEDGYDDGYADGRHACEGSEVA